MWQSFCHGLNLMVKGADDPLVSWPQGVFALLAPIGVAFFAHDYALYVVVFGPFSLLLGFVLREAWLRQPRHGKFGRVGRLSRDELAKARARLTTHANHSFPNLESHRGPQGRDSGLGQ
jgi:hypothetical protein